VHVTGAVQKDVTLAAPNACAGKFVPFPLR
jgi:hypothetical protein